ncbi:pyridoxal phosphate enzyme YggS family [Coprococcus sp. CAG:782]|jgi:pyridoxal phosphate enzyme (YggS family)|uniref:YggS family pyridoxal phosphate-dependent enzyme n=1 Tax=Coprococcus sp. OM04-5BH TaxID=2293093 RepID=UPI00033A51E5|nr:YggS family pyridoxal phosphate-dependent enzyme [Coprococcus sp. OM04-5BH]MEE0035073.1 YggS family pyridoxal phosphate-dependent enzyme [Coprococcus sp.]RHV32499.1 YggS family pyridoxal phosphate-dependent enzyme [Coprococcus sp. OM04-5BH]CCY53399.1 pyridoxal phosphate enzyme YggS family [Coprococcus sp. CAG:782]
MLKDNIAVVRKNIELACERAGRNPEEVTLIAVSKTKPLSDIEEVIATTDTRDFGENKVQEMVDKYEKVSTPVNWHLIGHLQTNKVKYIVDKACLIHSVDSFNLAKTIEKEAVKRNVTANILIEVNVAEEETKFGVRCEEVLPLIEQIKDLPHVKVKGLMTIAPFVENPEDNRVYFRTLRDLSLDIASKNIDNIDMSVLSMGMTNDYVVAVEEGATLVRVGTGIFGARNYNLS